MPAKHSTRRLGHCQEEIFLNQLHAIFKACPDVQFVLCGPRGDADQAKIPPRGVPWKGRRPTFRECAAHFEKGDGLGIVPASLGAVVVDVDEGGEDAVQALKDTLGEPVGVVPSAKPGRFHVWFRSPPGNVGNRKWTLPGGGAGDIRGSGGFVVLWRPDVFVERVLPRLVACEGAVADLSALKAAGRGKRKVVPVGQRNDTLNREAFAAACNGDAEGVREAAATARRSGLGDAEVGKTTTSAVDAAVAKVGADGKPRFPMSGAGFRDAMHAIGVEFRRNRRTDLFEYREDGAWAEATDEGDMCLIERMAEACARADGKGGPLRFGVNTFYQFRAATARRSDPIREYFESCVWDGEARLDAFASGIFAVEEAHRPLLAWAVRYLFVGAVQRTFEPGCELREMPILMGPQSCGKSSLLRYALPDALRLYGFSDALSLSRRDRDRIEDIVGTAIVECSEMAGLRRASIDGLKRFISCQADRGRLAYRRQVRTYPRQCVFVGTSNEHDALPADATGNTRFVGVPLLGRGTLGAPDAYLDDHRDQLWAEAVAMYRDGKRAGLPDALRELQRAVNAERTPDPYAALVEWLEATLTEPTYRISDVQTQLTASGAVGGRVYSDTVVARSLRRLGWARRHTMSGKVWVAPRR